MDKTSRMGVPLSAVAVQLVRIECDELVQYEAMQIGTEPKHIDQFLAQCLLGPEPECTPEMWVLDYIDEEWNTIGERVLTPKDGRRVRDKLRCRRVRESFDEETG